ncbi:hypothetical protein BCU41_015190 [Vibrio lentus]
MTTITNKKVKADVNIMASRSLFECLKKQKGAIASSFFTTIAGN